MTRQSDLQWLEPDATPQVRSIDVGSPSLGSNPLDETSEIDPFFAAAASLNEHVARRARTAASAVPAATDAETTPKPKKIAREARIAKTPKPRVRRRPQVPRLDEIELPKPSDALDRLLSDDERRRIACLSHLAEGEFAYDRFGFSPEVLRRATPILSSLYHYYFRVESRGHEHIPHDEGAILVGNHGGILPFDAAMVGTDVFLRLDPPRLVRTIVDRWAGQLPWVNIFFARAGQVIGTRENFAQLLDGNQLVLVFPEGMRGAVKPVTERYRLQNFRVGFIEQALRARVPIIPTAIVGSDDQNPIFFDFKSIARGIGMPTLPITPTFPWLGPLGLLPLPVRYRIEYGQPLHLYERFSPEDARDPELVRFLARQVRRAIQRLIDQHR